MRSFFRTIKRSWMAISRAVGLVMSSILLTVLWVVLFGLYAIVLKCICIFTRKKGTQESFWHAMPEEPGDYRYQF